MEHPSHTANLDSNLKVNAPGKEKSYSANLEGNPDTSINEASLEIDRPLLIIPATYTLSTDKPLLVSVEDPLSEKDMEIQEDLKSLSDKHITSAPPMRASNYNGGTKVVVTEQGTDITKFFGSIRAAAAFLGVGKSTVSKIKLKGINAPIIAAAKEIKGNSYSLTFGS